MRITPHHTHDQWLTPNQSKKGADVEKIKQEMEVGQSLTRWLLRRQAFCKLGSDCIRDCQREIRILRK